MNNKILKIVLRGVKNLDKEVSINFSNETFNLKPTNIKSIYGYNGCGKSAIIHAINIYRSLTLNKNYLNNDATKLYLNDLINRSLNNYEISVIYLIVLKDFKYLLKHNIKIVKKDNDFFIDSEDISISNRISLISNFKVLFASKNGIVRNYSTNKELTNRFLNIVDKSSISSILFENNLKINEDKIIKSFLNVVSTIYCYFESEEKPSIFAYKLKTNEKVAHAFATPIVMLGQQNVLKEFYDDYEKEVNNISNFLKIFKPTLNSIRIDKKIYGEYYACSKVFVYDDYEIDASLESTGIKKLFILYNYLELSYKGWFVLIDELDANINSVFLNKLLEFLKKNIKGTLLFTSHNIENIDVLKKEDHSISFLSIDGTLNDWVKNGNYSPKSQYAKGMIDGLPFNIDDFDFSKCFK